jgi:hypothetical protein
MSTNTVDSRSITMHQDVWDLVDSEAARSGRSIDTILEENARRALAGQRLVEFLDRVGGRVPAEEADKIAEEELRAVRNAR